MKLALVTWTPSHYVMVRRKRLMQHGSAPEGRRSKFRFIRAVCETQTPNCPFIWTDNYSTAAPNTTTFPHLPFLLPQQIKQTQTCKHPTPQGHGHVVPSRHTSIAHICAFHFSPTYTNKDKPNWYFPVSADFTALLPPPLSQPKQKQAITPLG